MPLSRRPDDTPVVQFDPRLEVSPFALFRRLKQDQPLLLVDVRGGPAAALTLAGAEPLPPGDWQPPADRDVVLFDDDGASAVEIATRLQAAGHVRVRALFGGLELYEFALDPEVVGEATFLVRRPA